MFEELLLIRHLYNSIFSFSVLVDNWIFNNEINLVKHTVTIKINESNTFH